MEKKKSYQDLLKQYTMTQQLNESETIEWQTDVFLNGLLQERYEKELRDNIDKALDLRDKATFIKLSEQLRQLTEA